MNPIVMIYVDLIKKGKKTIDDVKPESLKKDVIEALGGVNAEPGH